MNRTAKQKGNEFENLVAHEIKDMGLGEAHREVGSGRGNKKGDIFSNIPFLIECKNQKKLNWLESITQAKKQAEMGNFDANKWCLMVKDPRSPTELPNCYAVIDMWEFLKLLKKDKEPIVKEPDRQTAWHIKSAIQSLKTLLKDFE